MKYDMQWVSSPISDDVGLRWREQPEFYPISHKSSAYLMGHDLLEHFDMNDCSVMAEVFSVGAMIRVRGEDYFSLIKHPALNSTTLEELVIDGVLSEVHELLDNYSNDEIVHLTEPSDWTRRALACKVNCGDTLELLERCKLKLPEKLNEHQRAWYLDHQETIWAFVRLGYSMACKKYSKYSELKMAMLYKAITKATEQLLSLEDSFYEGLEFTLTTTPADGKVVITPKCSEIRQVFRYEFGHDRLVAHYY